MEERIKPQFINCPACQGQGIDKENKMCKECSSIGTGSFFRNVFLYWGLELSKEIIFLRKIKRLLYNLINLIALIISLAGVLSLVWWMLNFPDPYSLDTYFFWRYTHGLLLIFWISILADQFLVYRFTEKRISKYKINKKSFKNNEISSEKLPNNWKELVSFEQKIDVSRALNKQSNKIVEDAFMLASKYKYSSVNPKHIFFEILNQNETKALFARLNVNHKDIQLIVKRMIENNVGTAKSRSIIFSNESKEAFIKAYTDAFLNNQIDVNIQNLIIPIIEADDDLVEILYDFDIDVEKINNVNEWFKVNDKLIEAYKRYKKMARFKPKTNMDRAYTAIETPILNNYSYDLTLAAKLARLDFCVGRDKEIEDAFKSLEKGENGVLFVGPPGVGKRTIISGIAERMVSEEVPKILRDKRLLELDLARLVAGSDAAQAQDRLSQIIQEINRAKNIVLFINNLENVVGISAGEEESVELSDVLIGALERKEIVCFSISITRNYVKYIENQPIGNAMSVIKVNEPKGNQAIQIVESKIGVIENKYKIYFSYRAIDEAVKLSDKYIQDKYLPAKAIDILETVAVNVAKRCKQDSSKCICAREDVQEVVSDITSIPMKKVSSKESEVLLSLEDEIHKRMINQDEAVKIVANSLRRARTELSEGKRPIASFLFLGPTGVGKTELAKSVAEVYFGNEKSMIRVDMSEYQQPESLNKMIGDETGNSGYLTEAVRKSPFSLILLDEFEKAHSNILNLFLQVMDDGRLTDGQGRTIDFTSTIIIATSNACALFIQDQIKRNIDLDKIKENLIQEELIKVMKPELVNRFDGIIVFKPLSKENVIDITRLMLVKFSTILEKQGINLQVNEGGIRKLAFEGYNQKFGARPLRRLLQEKIENNIASKILTNEIQRRDTVVIDSNGKIRVEKGRKLI